MATTYNVGAKSRRRIAVPSEITTTGITATSNSPSPHTSPWQWKMRSRSRHRARHPRESRRPPPLDEGVRGIPKEILGRPDQEGSPDHLLLSRLLVLDVGI